MLRKIKLWLDSYRITIAQYLERLPKRPSGGNYGRISPELIGLKEMYDNGELELESFNIVEGEEEIEIIQHSKRSVVLEVIPELANKNVTLECGNKVLVKLKKTENYIVLLIEGKLVGEETIKITSVENPEITMELIVNILPISS